MTMRERVFKRKVLDANILKEMHANNVCYSKHSKDRFIPFRFDKSRYVECKLFKKITFLAIQLSLVAQAVRNSWNF